MKQKKLLMLAAAVAVLFGAYFGVRALTAQQAKAQDAGDSTTVRVLKGAVNTITATHDKGGAADADGANDGAGTSGAANTSGADTASTASWTLTRVDDTWQWADDAAFPLMQTVPQAMADAVQGGSTATRVLDDLAAAQGSAADYGLDAPTSIILLTTDEGDAMTLTFGAENTHTGDTYLTVSDDAALYTADLSLVQTFAYAVYDMLALETWPVTAPAQILSVSVAQGSAANRTLRLDVAQNGSGETTYTVSENGTAHAANAQAAIAFLQDVAALSVGGCADYKASDDTLAQYGLQAPVATITVVWLDAEDATQTTTLHVGTGEEAAVYYTQLQGSTAVNTMEGMAVAQVLNATATNLVAAQTP